jgi:anti-sigma B factor antagonist
MNLGAEPLARVVSRSGNTATVAVGGEIDIANAAHLRDCLTGCLADGCTEITLDMEEVTFMGASGLSVLADVTELAESCGGRLILQKTPARIQKVIQIAGLAAAIHIVEPASSRDQR